MLKQQHRNRLAEFVPIRVSRMLESRFAFYRGTALLMAYDLGRQPMSNVSVISCGDAHIANFGFYATPERALAFDLNDFDEGGMAPFEWDVKRLATSALIAASDRGFTSKQIRKAVRKTAEAYREGMLAMLELPILDRFYHRLLDSRRVRKKLDDKSWRLVSATAREARRRTSDRVLDRIVTIGKGKRARIIDQPPLMVHVAWLSLADVRKLLAAYAVTVRMDTAQVLSRFKVEDFALRVVGVGSVGTRCLIVYLSGPDGEPLFLQVKEAPPSVLESFGGLSSSFAALDPLRRASGGFRVVAVQQILQTASDPFLGYLSAGGRDYYVRQFRDMKGSLDIAALRPKQFVAYSRVCAKLLARSHGQSSASSRLASWLDDEFPGAILDWAEAYGERVNADYQAVRQAVRIGRLPTADE